MMVWRWIVILIGMTTMVEINIRMMMLMVTVMYDNVYNVDGDDDGYGNVDDNWNTICVRSANLRR